MERSEAHPGMDVGLRGHTTAAPYVGFVPHKPLYGAMSSQLNWCAQHLKGGSMADVSNPESSINSLSPAVPLESYRIVDLERYLISLLSPEFLSKYTRYATLREFLEACNRHELQELADNPPDDETMIQNTRFQSWADMLYNAERILTTEVQKSDRSSLAMHRDSSAVK